MKAPKAKAKAGAAVVAEGQARRRERLKATNKDKEKAMTTETKAAAPVDVPPVAPGTHPGETPAEPAKPLKVKVGPKGEEKEQQVDPAVLGNRATLTAGLGMAGKAVTSVDVFRYGVTDVFEFAVGDVHFFIKDRQGVIEIGGTADWDTGVKAANL